MVEKTLLVFFGIVMLIEVALLVGVAYVLHRIGGWQAQVERWRNNLPQAIESARTMMREGKVTLDQLATALTWIEKKFPLWLRACLATMRWTRRSLRGPSA